MATIFLTKLRLDRYQQISNRCIPSNVELEVPKSDFYKTIKNQNYELKNYIIELFLG